MLIHNAILSVAEASATFELLLFWLLRLMSKYCFALMQSLYNSIFPCAQGNTFWDMLTNGIQGVLVLMVLGWFWRRRLSRKCLSGERCFLQIIGAIFKSKGSFLLSISLLIAVLCLIPKISMRLKGDDYSSPHSILYKVGIIGVSCILFGVATYVITNLNKDIQSAQAGDSDNGQPDSIVGCLWYLLYSRRLCPWHRTEGQWFYHRYHFWCCSRLDLSRYY